MSLFRGSASRCSPMPLLGTGRSKLYATPADGARGPAWRAWTGPGGAPGSGGIGKIGGPSRPRVTRAKRPADPPFPGGGRRKTGWRD
jgi:hypothetical protein